MKTHRTVTDSV